MADFSAQGADDANQIPRLLSISLAAQVLGLSRTSLYELMASGRILSVTIGRRRFVPREAIDEFIAGLPTQYRRRP
jgi:excisionase family DNA binding protein